MIRDYLVYDYYLLVVLMVKVIWLMFEDAE